MHLSAVDGRVNLQATLSASSATTAPAPVPHHPITCASNLRFDPDAGVLECEHAATEPGDLRTRQCIEHSLAILLIELAVANFG